MSTSWDQVEMEYFSKCYLVPQNFPHKVQILEILACPSKMCYP